MIMMSDNLSWFIGVVENRMDPLEQGRVQVRVGGVHPFSRIQGDVLGIPVEDLPWMSTVLPVTSPSVAGISGSVTGLLEGSSVFGIWLDTYKTNGLVLGVYSGNQVNIPNPDEGFSDPSGQYPGSAGPDTNGLNAGGAYGDQSPYNVMQNSNSSTGILAGGKDVAGEDNNPSMSINKMLVGDEGIKLHVYWDSMQYPTVGIGHLILRKKTRDMSVILSKLSNDLGRTSGSNISRADADRLFASDLAKVQSEISKNRTIAPAYARANASRKMALVNMAFQLGTGGLAKFKTALGLMAAGNWAQAAAQAKNSLWARQTPGRANRICIVIKNGNLGSYGVMPPTMIGRSILRETSSSLNFIYDSDEDDDIDWAEEPPVDDSATLFVEPKSSYRGEYPYVQSTTTEGGHLQEFDNTPNQERYRLVHPSGSYVEVAADGRKTDKSSGDKYDISGRDRNTLTEGKYNVNVGGQETYVNFADVKRIIDGSNSLEITGNETKTITGDETITINGNETKVVDGTGNLTVKGTLSITVEADANITVNGNCVSNITGNCTSTVSGDYSLSCASYTVNASGPVLFTTPRMDVQ